jgi:hypothetical protein
MTRLTKFCVATALAGLVVGLLVSFGVFEVGSHVAWYVALPVGVIFIGLALICYALEKEVARFDEEYNQPSAAGRPPKTEHAAPENHGCGCQLGADAKSSA